MRLIIFLLAIGQIYILTACSFQGKDPSENISLAQNPTPNAMPTYTQTTFTDPTLTIQPFIINPAALHQTNLLEQIIQLDEALSGIILEFTYHPDTHQFTLVTTNGIAFIDGNSAQTLIPPEGYFILGIDPNLYIWLLDERIGRDIYRWDGGESLETFSSQWQPIDQPSELLGERINADWQGNLWITTSKDVRQFDGENWKIWTKKEIGMADSADPDILSKLTPFSFPGSKLLFIASCDYACPGPIGGSGIRWFDGASWHGSNTPAQDGCVNSITQDTSGIFWIGINQSLWLFDPNQNTWRSHPSLHSSPDFRLAYVQEILINPQGIPWVCFNLCGGASCGNFARFRYDNSGWEQVGETTGLPDQVVFQKLSSSYLVIREDGINLYQAGMEAIRLDTSPGFRVFAATLGRSGQVWMIGKELEKPLSVWKFTGS